MLSSPRGHAFAAWVLALIRGRHGGVEKRGGWKTSRMTPFPKRGFGPPSYGTFSTPLRCQCSVSPVQRPHDRADQKLFWRGPKIFGRAGSLVRFPPPIRFAPPHITAQFKEPEMSLVQYREATTSSEVSSAVVSGVCPPVL